MTKPYKPNVLLAKVESDFGEDPSGNKDGEFGSSEIQGHVGFVLPMSIIWLCSLSLAFSLSAMFCVVLLLAMSW